MLQVRRHNKFNIILSATRTHKQATAKTLHFHLRGCRVHICSLLLPPHSVSSQSHWHRSSLRFLGVTSLHSIFATFNNTISHHPHLCSFFPHTSQKSSQSFTRNKTIFVPAFPSRRSHAPRQEYSAASRPARSGGGAAD